MKKYPTHPSNLSHDLTSLDNSSLELENLLEQRQDMDRQEAEKLVHAVMSATKLDAPDDLLIIFDEQTVEKSYGWIFVWGSKMFRETRNLKYAIGGNCPLVVERESGRLHYLTTALPLEQSIKDFERTMNLSQD